MKKFIFVFISALLIVLTVSACGDEENSKKSTDSKYPTASNTVKGNNQTERCYNTDIDSFTKKFNELYKKKTNKEGPVVDMGGGYHPLSKDNWQTQGDKKQKDGNTTYTLYTQSTEKAEIILAVDDITKNIITFSTATTNEVWKKYSKDVKAVTIIGSMSLGKYDVKNYKFFNDLFDTAISGMCYYDNVAYRVSGITRDKKGKNELIIKLISIPTTENALRVTSYTDYKLYKEGKCDFGQHTEKTTSSQAKDNN